MSNRPIPRRTFVMHPLLPALHSDAVRTPETRLLEAEGLARAIHLEIADTDIIPVREIRPATLFGTGKVKEIGTCLKAEEIELVILDTTLSPVQQRNLEKAWQCKVIDRTALILEIFGERARTREGRMQVELATLQYQKSRLVRSWTHLERQRGGHGVMGGPGEKQIESDRRILNDRIAKLRKNLDSVRRTRTIHREARAKVPYPIVALVGYTNAGKSTLFNRLTGAKVMAEDALFATLDPTMRECTLPGGMKIILSDTVGFISDLPTELVAAFRATLEEVTQADVLLHVRDASSPDTRAQKQDVLAVLRSLVSEETLEQQSIEVLNKTDQMAFPPDIGPQQVALSALTGEGVSSLLEAVENKLAHWRQAYEFAIPAEDGKRLAWLHAHGERVSVEMDGDSAKVQVWLSPKDAARFEQMSTS